MNLLPTIRQRQNSVPFFELSPTSAYSRAWRAGTPEMWEEYKRVHPVKYREWKEEKNRKLKAVRGTLEGAENHRAVSRRHRARHPIRALLSRYRRAGVKVTEQEYLAALQSQGNRCKICGSPPPVSGQFTRLNLDHCHATNKFRGLLCQKCNIGIGAFRDSAPLLEAAIRYLSDAQNL